MGLGSMIAKGAAGAIEHHGNKHDKPAAEQAAPAAPAASAAADTTMRGSVSALGDSTSEAPALSAAQSIDVGHLTRAATGLVGTLHGLEAGLLRGDRSDDSREAREEQKTKRSVFGGLASGLRKAASGDLGGAVGEVAVKSGSAVVSHEWKQLQESGTLLDKGVVASLVAQHASHIQGDANRASSDHAVAQRLQTTVENTVGAIGVVEQQKPRSTDITYSKPTFDVSRPDQQGTFLREYSRAASARPYNPDSDGPKLTEEQVEKALKTLDGKMKGADKAEVEKIMKMPHGTSEEQYRREVATLGVLGKYLQTQH